MFLKNQREDIARKKKASLIKKEFMRALHSIFGLDNTLFQGITFTDIILERKKHPTILLYSEESEEKGVKAIRSILKHKNTINKILTTNLNFRYPIRLRFRYDNSFKKVQALEKIYKKIEDEKI
jgi:ribosome-binding factor A